MLFWILKRYVPFEFELRFVNCGERELLVAIVDNVMLSGKLGLLGFWVLRMICQGLLSLVKYLVLP